MIKVIVTIKRGEEAQGKTYEFTESGESKKGTFKTFSPAGENADLPAFGKLYVKAKRGEAKAEKKANGKKS